MTDRDRSNWEHWMTRIPIDDSDRLMELGFILIKYNKITKVDKYNITRFALLHLEKNLEHELTKLKTQENN